MLALLLSLAFADFDGGYTYDTAGCYISYGCDSCDRCEDLACELEQEDAGRSLACREGEGDDAYSVWCDCGGGGDDDDDDDTTGDDDDDTTGDDDDDKAGACGGCDAAQSPIAVFGTLALLSGGLLMRRRRDGDR